MSYFNEDYDILKDFSTTVDTKSKNFQLSVKITHWK